jgi:transcriptional regulator with XRE-family HTH domain
MTIDEILKAIRKEMGISQESLARELNVSFAAINRWENNKAKPSRLAMLQIKEFAARNSVSEEIADALERIRV